MPIATHLWLCTATLIAAGFWFSHVSTAELDKVYHEVNAQGVSTYNQLDMLRDKLTDLELKLDTIDVSINDIPGPGGAQ